jgi:hypothetical protein
LLAEFLCYSEQYKLNYFDILLESNVLLVDLPRILSMDSRKINTQLMQTIQIMVNFTKDPSNLTILFGADLLRQLIEIDCTFDDELVDFYISMLKSLVLRLQEQPHLINLFYSNSTKQYPLFVQAQ